MGMTPVVWARPSDQRLWERVEWLKLLHYERGPSGAYKSQADGPSFFLAGQDGIKSPQKELEATLRGFSDPVSLEDPDSHPQCRFPARLLWLQSVSALERAHLPKVSCKAYQEFKERTKAQSATLIFSSYYLNNPSSAFGHTFLRLNKKRDTVLQTRSELLDEGIDYAAVVTTESPLLYAFMGLTGFFKGTFNDIPYYFKVRQYNDYESRDLWEYDLSLSPEEMTLLVAHLWELGSTYFDYYYLSENCSYHMLTLLEAAAPRLDMVRHLPVYVIPSDTIVILAEVPGLVNQIHYRPSLRTRFYHQLSLLGPEERKELKQLLKKKDFDFPKTFSEPPQSTRVLDAAIDYTDYRYGQDLLKGDLKRSQFKQALLLARSRLGVPSQDLSIPIPQEETPHRGHGSARTGGGLGASSQGPYLQFTHRFALHDFLDRGTAYPEQVEIEFLRFDLRHHLEGQDFWVEEASLFNVFSLTDFGYFNRAFSWKFRLGGRTFRDGVCDDCFGGLAEGGAGISKRLNLGVPVWMTVTADAEVSGSPEFRGPDARLRYGPLGQIRISFLPGLQFLLKTWYRRPLVTDYSSEILSQAGLRWGFGKSLALDFKGRYDWKTKSWEGGMNVLFYY